MIVATVVLHNIAVIMGDVVPPDDQELSAYVQHRRAVGLQVDYDPVVVGPPCIANYLGANATRQALIESHFA